MIKTLVVIAGRERGAGDILAGVQRGHRARRTANASPKTSAKRRQRCSTRSWSKSRARPARDTPPQGEERELARSQRARLAARRGDGERRGVAAVPVDARLGPSASSRAEQVAPKNPARRRTHPSRRRTRHARPRTPASPGHRGRRRRRAGRRIAARAPRRGRCTRRRTTSRVGPEAPSARRGPLRRREHGPRPVIVVVGFLLLLLKNSSKRLARGTVAASPASNAAPRRLSSAAARRRRRCRTEGWPARTPSATAGPPTPTKTETPPRARGGSSGSPPRSAVVSIRRRRRRRIRRDDASSRVKKSTARERDERLGVVRVRARARRARRRAAKHGERISPEEHARGAPRRALAWSASRSGTARAPERQRGSRRDDPPRSRGPPPRAGAARGPRRASRASRRSSRRRARGRGGTRELWSRRPPRSRGGTPAYSAEDTAAASASKPRAPARARLVPRQRPVDPARPARRRAAVVHAHVRRLVRVGKEGEEHLVVVLHRAVHAVAKRAGRVVGSRTPSRRPRPPQNLELAFPRRVRRRRPARARLARRGARGRRRRRRRRRTPRTAPR